MAKANLVRQLQLDAWGECLKNDNVPMKAVTVASAHQEQIKAPTRSFFNSTKAETALAIDNVSSQTLTARTKSR